MADEGGKAEKVGIDRLKHETKLHHRGLVLYAMQDEGKRSLRATAPAVGRTEGALRGWARRFRWEERIEAEGLTVQARACQLYRDLYHGDWRLRDVAGAVEQRMSVPVLSTSPPPKPGGTGEATAQVIAQATADGERQKPAELSERDRAIRVLRTQRSIAEEGLKLFATALQGPKEGKPIVTVRDAVALMREHRDISELLGDLAPPTATPTAMETSFRVREAERLGRNVTEAILEDTLELQAILRTVLDAEELDPAWLEPAQAAQREERATEAEDDEAAEG